MRPGASSDSNPNLRAMAHSSSKPERRLIELRLTGPRELAVRR